MAEGVGDTTPQHEFLGGHVDDRCRALFHRTSGNTWECGMPRSNDIHLIEVEEPTPIEPVEATGLDEHTVFTIPVDGAVSVELRKLEQHLDHQAMQLQMIPFEHCREEAKRVLHTSMRLAAIALALEEGRLQIHPRTIDHQVARAAWEMDQQIPTTEDSHAHG